MYKRYIILFLTLSATVIGCSKYLDKKSNKNLSIPDNLPDIELLLNNTVELNAAAETPNSASDEYYLSAEDYESMNLLSRNMYIWDPQTQSQNDWQFYYRAILTVNTALENIEKIDRQTDPEKWDDLKGRAVFFRGVYFWLLAQIYAPPYPENEDSEFGIPIRLDPDFNKPVSRSTLQQTYDQILADIISSIGLLPDKNLHNTQPSRWAAYAMAARVYLSMGNYQKAYDYSDSCLKLSAPLMNYNSIDGAQEFPFLRNNPEVIFHLSTENSVLGYYWMAKVDSSIYKTYADNDLRKMLFFIDNADGSHGFRGNYSSSYLLFNGLAVDEMYLTKAEAAVRLGNTDQALESMNTLLRTRYATNAYKNIETRDPAELLRLVLLERRKELLARGLRWSDLRRLNREAEFRTTLVRKLNGQEFQLLPDDLRYTFLIPQESINASGIPQNPR